MTRTAPSAPGHDPAAGAEPPRLHTRGPTAEEPADPAADAAAFAALFRAIYLTYHCRDGPRSGLTAGRAWWRGEQPPPLERAPGRDERAWTGPVDTVSNMRAKLAERSDSSFQGDETAEPLARPPVER